MALLITGWGLFIAPYFGTMKVDYNIIFFFWQN
nr:MAG TPA: hypothetical protein [Caudoviricetes sp.]